ncbi:hypothetical protein [Nostoc sp. NMS4]|uniref:hypothetical protein n=1 Tax=Nostoc sp. NMS4 TaxID=2815390 RepID=UPI0025E44BDC|nr:hypothetical protein [Nostoc sp. NMS4]
MLEGNTRYLKKMTYRMYTINAQLIGFFIKFMDVITLIQKLIKLSGNTKELKIVPLPESLGVQIIFDEGSQLVVDENFSKEDELLHLLIKEIESQKWSYVIKATWFETDQVGALTYNRYDYYVKVDTEVAIAESKVEALIAALSRKLT